MRCPFETSPTKVMAPPLRVIWRLASYGRWAPTLEVRSRVAIWISSSALPLRGAGLPMPNVLFRTFFGSTPGVRFYSGTPDMNMSGTVFPDAVLIWSAQDPHWQARIDSIKPNSAAGKASRDTDTIPLRAEQMKVPECALADVARWQRDGIFEWDFFPLNNALACDIPTQDIGSKETRLFECARGLGQKTQDLIPVIWRVMRETEPEGFWATAADEGATLRCGGTLIHVGTPALALKHFESKKVTHLMLVPHRTARGPNGVWLIRRGPNHPLRLGFKKCGAFYVCASDSLMTLDSQTARSDEAIELFDLKSQANETLKKMKLMSSKSLRVIHVQAFELYDLIGRSKVIKHGEELIKLTAASASHEALLS